MPHRRRVFHRIAAASIALVVSATLVGCSTSNADARTTVDAFLAALDSSDGEAALAMTTTPRGEVECLELLPETRIGAVEVGDVVATGDSATAEVSYMVFEDRVSHTLDLELTSGTWKIVLPESFRIRTPAPPSVVVQAVIERGCVLNVIDGYFETVALPGAYSLQLSDPSGVFPSSILGFVSVPQSTPDTGAEYVEGSEYASPVERDILANLLAVDIQNAVIECIKSGFAGSTCPDGLPVADESQDVSRAPTLVTDFPRASVFSDDGATWRFETTTEHLLVQVGGAIVEAPFSYTGTVTVDDEGEPVAVFD